MREGNLRYERFTAECKVVFEIMNVFHSILGRWAAFQSLSLKQGYKHTPSNMTKHRDHDAVERTLKKLDNYFVCLRRGIPNAMHRS
jgi:hypothetical protein